MTIKATNWAWDQKLDPTLKLVLLALADNASDVGDKCWPSIKLVSRKSCISERTVQRCIKTLEERGFIKVTRRFRNNKSQTSNSYQLNISAPDKLSPPRELCHPRDDMSVIQQVTQPCQGGGDKIVSPPEQPREQPREQKHEQPEKNLSAFNELNEIEKNKILAILKTQNANESNDLRSILETALLNNTIQLSPSLWLQGTINNRKGNNKSTSPSLPINHEKKLHAEEDAKRYASTDEVIRHIAKMKLVVGK